MSLFYNPLGVIAGLLTLVVFIRLLLWCLNNLLLWMDQKDWILIPNAEAIQAADSAIARMALEVQALYEPAKRHMIEAEVKREDKTYNDEQGA